MQARVFPQKFLGAFVLNDRGLHTHFHQLIAACSGARVEHALLPQAEFLAVLGSLGDFKQRPAVNGGNFDFCTQTGFVDADGNRDFDVVAVAPEKRMRLHADGYVKIAGRRAEGPGVALALHPQAGSLLGAGRNADVHDLGFGNAAVAMAIRTAISQAAGTLAARTRETEAHGAGHLSYVPATVAFRTNRVGSGTRSGAVTRRARLL